MTGFFRDYGGDMFTEFERMRREMDNLFGDWELSPLGLRSVGTGTFPAINIGVSPERVDVYVFAAGLDPKQFDISLQQNLLTISGTRETDQPKEAQPYRQERFTGNFRRICTLPEDVNPDQVEASYHDGVLQITVQRQEVVRPRRIQVQ